MTSIVFQIQDGALKNQMNQELNYEFKMVELAWKV